MDMWVLHLRFIVRLFDRLARQPLALTHIILRSSNLFDLFWFDLNSELYFSQHFLLFALCSERFASASASASATLIDSGATVLLAI